MKNILFNSFKSILLMTTFFTRIPVKIQSEFNDSDYKLGILFLPVIGIVVGIGLGVLKLFSLISSTYVVGLILTLFYLWISGGIHLDGLGDTLDGLFSGRGKERQLEIMKDSRLGTFGALGLIFVVIAYVILLGEGSLASVLLMPVVGKSSTMLSAYMSTYARGEEGLGYKFVTLSDKSVRNSAFGFSFVLCIILNYMFLIPVVLTFAAVGIVTKSISKKIGGTTGDTLGFVNEFSQILFLIIANFIV